MFDESYIPFLKLIQSEVFHCTVIENKKESEKISRIAFEDIFNLTTPILNEKATVLIARGSLGRKEMTLFSDIDLILICKSVKYKKHYNYLVNTLSQKHRNILVLPVYSLLDLKRNISLIELFSLMDSRFICGNRKLFYEWKKTLMSICKRQKISKLFKLYYDDNYRSTLSSVNTASNFHSIKRGNCGMIDYYFCRLLIFWVRINNYEINKETISTFMYLQQLNNYNISLKMKLEILFKKNVDSYMLFTNLNDIAVKNKLDQSDIPWFFKIENILQIKNAHLKILSHYFDYFTKFSIEYEK